MVLIQGQLPTGDPDFDLLQITAGAGAGLPLPSPGHTTLTRQGPPGSSWAVDSFFDIFYQINFTGKPGGTLGGYSGSTTGTIRMVAVHPPTPLTVNCSSDITVTATSPTGAVVTFASSASGGCDPAPTVVCNPPSGTTFPIGPTTVTCTASNVCGQTAECSFTVTVVPPPITLTCSSNLTVATTSAAGAVVTYTSSASGGCAPVTVNCNPPSGSTFSIGTTPVTCTASDGCGQTTNCGFTVTVVRLTLTIQPVGNQQVRVTWSTGTLQQADQVQGPYIDIDPQPTSPWTFTPAGAKKFFRVRAGQPGFTFYDTEMLQLNITGGNLPAGMMIRESPTLASTGKTAISPATGGGYIIDSFFDVFTELSTDGGQTWLASTSAPPRMRFTSTASSTNALPPKDANYVSPADWHAAYAQGIYLTNASHLGFTASYPPPAPGGTTDIHSFGSTVNMLVRQGPTGPFTPVTAPAQVTVRVTSRP
jgi:hypothetical protein